MGEGRQNALVRYIHNERMADACHQWAFAALTGSAGARRYYDSQRDRKKDHNQALRALANRLVGILDGCLRHRQLYHEAIASESGSKTSEGLGFPGRGLDFTAVG